MSYEKAPPSKETMEDSEAGPAIKSRLLSHPHLQHPDFKLAEQQFQELQANPIWQSFFMQPISQEDDWALNL